MSDMNPPSQSGKVPPSDSSDSTAKRRRVASYDRPDRPTGAGAGISPMIILGLIVLVLVILIAAYLLLFAGK